MQDGVTPDDVEALIECMPATSETHHRAVLRAVDLGGPTGAIRDLPARALAQMLRLREDSGEAITEEWLAPFIEHVTWRKMRLMEVCDALGPKAERALRLLDPAGVIASSSEEVRTAAMLVLAQSTGEGVREAVFNTHRTLRWSKGFQRKVEFLVASWQREPLLEAARVGRAALALGIKDGAVKEVARDILRRQGASRKFVEDAVRAAPFEWTHERLESLLSAMPHLEHQWVTELDMVGPTKGIGCLNLRLLAQRVLQADGADAIEAALRASEVSLRQKPLKHQALLEVLPPEKADHVVACDLLGPTAPLFERPLRALAQRARACATDEALGELIEADMRPLGAEYWRQEGRFDALLDVLEPSQAAVVRRADLSERVARIADARLRALAVEIMAAAAEDADAKKLAIDKANDGMVDWSETAVDELSAALCIDDALLLRSLATGCTTRRHLAVLATMLHEAEHAGVPSVAMEKIVRGAQVRWTTNSVEELMALSSPLAAKVVRELDLVGPTRNILDRDVRLLAQCIRRTGDLRRIKQEIWRSDAVLDGESLLELIRAVPGQQGIALVSLLGTSGMVGAEHYEQAVVNVSAEDEPEAALTLLDEMRQNGMTPSGDAYRTVLMSLAQASQPDGGNSPLWWERIDKLLNTMVESGAELNSALGGDLIAAACSGNSLKPTLLLLRRIRQSGWAPPDEAVYAPHLAALCARAGDAGKAAVLVQRARERSGADAAAEVARAALDSAPHAARRELERLCAI